jgi:hypothetical protein
VLLILKILTVSKGSKVLINSVCFEALQFLKLAVLINYRHDEYMRILFLQFANLKKHWRTACLITFAAVCAISVIGLVIGPNGREMVQYVVPVFVYGISNGGDVEECSKIRDTFLLRHDIPKNAKSISGQSPVFCNPGSDGVVFKVPPTFIIYGAMDKTIQDQYLSTLESIRSKIGANKIQVEFYEKENWIELKSPQASSGHRGPELLLREVTLDH